MLKFFRGIRNSLTPQGRISRYFIYAIGEIFLVVIGILLALQVNNWNNNRINSKLEKEYINRLSNEIKSDLKYFEHLKEAFAEKENSLLRIVRVWQSENPVLIDSVQYMNDFKSAGELGPWYKEPVTWTQLIQTGDLKLIKDQKLLDQLFFYNARVKQFATNFSMYPMTMTNWARENYHTPFRQVDPSQYFSKRNFTEPTGKSVYKNIWDQKDEYIPTYTSLAYIGKVQMIGFESLIEMGEALLDKMESK